MVAPEPLGRVVIGGDVGVVVGGGGRVAGGLAEGG